MLYQGGPTLCSWRANLHFHKNIEGHQKKKIILLPIYILFYIMQKLLHYRLSYFF